MIADSLRLLAISLKDLGVQIPEDLNAVTDPAATLTLLAVLREHRKEIQFLEDYVQQVAAKRMDSSVLEWNGGRAIRRHTKESIKWEPTEAVASKVMGAVLVDRETGEVASEVETAMANRLKAAFVKCAPLRIAWRVEALKELEIEADDFRRWQKGRPVVEVLLGEDALMEQESEQARQLAKLQRQIEAGRRHPGETA